MKNCPWQKSHPLPLPPSFAGNPMEMTPQDVEVKCVDDEFAFLTCVQKTRVAIGPSHLEDVDDERAPPEGDIQLAATNVFKRDDRGVWKMVSHFPQRV